MDIQDVTSEKVRVFSSAGQAVIRLAEAKGKPPTAVIRELTRRPLRLRELLLILECRARGARDDAEKSAGAR